MIKRKTKIRPLAKDCENGSPEKIKNRSINKRGVFFVCFFLLKRYVLFCQLHSVFQLKHHGCLKNEVSHVVSIANAASPI